MTSSLEVARGRQKKRRRSVIRALAMYMQIILNSCSEILIEVTMLSVFGHFRTITGIPACLGSAHSVLDRAILLLLSLDIENRQIIFCWKAYLAFINLVDVGE